MYVQLNGASGLSGYRGLGDSFDPKNFPLNSSNAVQFLQNTIGTKMSAGGFQSLISALTSPWQLANTLQGAYWGNSVSSPDQMQSNLAGVPASILNSMQTGAQQVDATHLLFPNGDLVTCQSFSPDLPFYVDPTSSNACQQDSQSRQMVIGAQNAAIQRAAGSGGSVAAPATTPSAAAQANTLPSWWSPQPTQPAYTPPPQPTYTVSYAPAPEMTQPALTSNLMQAAPQNQLYQPSPLITPPSSAGPASAGALPAAASTSTGSGVLDSAMSWISANPMLAAAGALGALFLFGGMGGRR